MSKEISIRNAVEADIESLTQIYNHYVVNTHITFDLEPVSIENRLEWFSHYNQNDVHRLLVAETDQRVLGYTSSSQFRVKPAYSNSVETTIYIDPDATGRSVGRKLYSALLDALTETSVHRCYGVIALPNDESIALHRQLGFEEAGRFSEVGFKFDRYWDTLWLEKRFS
jgi:phosphinothricin acetyltransferase